MIKKVEVGAINITMHPHNPEKYVELFKAAKALDRPIHVKGTTYASLSELHKMKKVPAGEKIAPLYGDIIKYTDIPPGSDWFDSRTGQFADEEEREKAEKINYLKPLGVRFSFIFFPQDHILVYSKYQDQKSLGSTSATDFFKGLLNQQELLDTFNEVNVTHLPQHEAVEAAINLKFKRAIELTITRPNSIEDAERKLLARYNKLNVNSVKEEYKAINGQQIEMDDELEELSRIAARNGTLTVKGRDEGQRRTVITTTDRPFSMSDSFNDNIIDHYNSFKELAYQAIDYLRNLRR
ncbi:DUF4747 family protein [Pseudoalteromonas sp. McH1-7]|uniref:DUF4747 family protein n=1 Tax=Pseudoalteromonas sp. McH1-7 TaxID=2745574 RepID=UPI0015919CD2|nr:DUF4747 family protein [Pseudoalteromonas sp. McH1-7]NUZ10166.1 DUF4747 family protein [Pseudoalteromonas sp. McH1-7]